MRNLIVLIAIVLCSVFAAHSQVKVTTVVLDEKGNPISDAIVYNSSTKLSVITNEEGRFEMDCRADDGIEIRCFGCQEYKNTAGELQNNVITLKEAVMDMSKATVDAKVIIRKFLGRIPKNYTQKATIISGVYKESASMDDDYYGGIQSEVSILVDHITSRSFPAYKTKVHNLKSYKRPNIEQTLHGNSGYYYSQFWLFCHSFLWNMTRFQYHNMGAITFDGSKLIKIAFHPDQTDKLIKQYAGIMYIDMKTYALVYLQYELLPNEMDYYLFEGREQKQTKEETKIMFKSYKGCYYPAYVTCNGMATVKGAEWEMFNPDNKETLNMKLIFKFFTKEIITSTIDFVADCQLVDEINLKEMNMVEQTEDQTNNIIMETEKEKQLLKKYWKKNEKSTNITKGFGGEKSTPISSQVRQ